MKLSQLICEVCRLASAAAQFVWAQVNKRYPGQHFVPVSAFDGLEPAPQQQQLRDLLHAQSPATIYLLVTLWRLGRGDFPADENLLNEYLEVGDSFPHVRAAVDYLMGKNLPPYFDEALRQLAEAGMQVDGLMD